MDEQNQLVVDGADLVSHPKKATGAKTMPSQPTMRTLPVLAFAVLLGPILASSPSPSTVNDDRLDPRQDEALEGDVGRMTNASTAAAGAAADRCGLWLAPSTIPGAGLGMFAGKEYDENDPIGPPDLVIPVVDYHAHNPENEDEIIFDYYGWNTFRCVAWMSTGLVCNREHPLLTFDCSLFRDMRALLLLPLPASKSPLASLTLKTKVWLTASPLASVRGLALR
jgi:hypothetical protein